MIPVNETFVKRIARTFFEDGLVQALKEAAAADQQNHPIIGVFAKYSLWLVDVHTKWNVFFRPHIKDQGVHCITQFSQTKDWQQSLIRVLKWHPNCFKIAAAACDDSIRIYTDQTPIVPILKVNCLSKITTKIN